MNIVLWSSSGVWFVCSSMMFCAVICCFVFCLKLSFIMVVSNCIIILGGCGLCSCLLLFLLSLIVLLIALNVLYLNVCRSILLSLAILIIVWLSCAFVSVFVYGTLCIVSSWSGFCSGTIILIVCCGCG